MVTKHYVHLNFDRSFEGRFNGLSSYIYIDEENTEEGVAVAALPPLVNVLSLWEA